MIKKEIIDKINLKLQESYVMELSKPEINKFERARILKKYMVDNKLSLIQMCHRFNFKKGTLSGWLKWSELGERRYNSMKNKGMTETEITNMLKGENETPNDKFIKTLEKLNDLLDKNKIKINKELIEDIRRIRNKLNTIIYKYSEKI